MKSLNKSYEIKNTPDKVFEAFTDADFIENWSKSPAIMDANEGTEFSLFGGQVHGVNREVVKNERIVQDWYGGDDWDQPSKVTILFQQEREYTLVDIQQEGIPDEYLPEIEQMWDELYLGRIQSLMDEELDSDFVNHDDMGLGYQDPTTKE